MKKNILLFCFLGFSIATFAQKPFLYGTVTGGEKGEILTGAAVMVKTLRDSLVMAVVTNDKGHFEFRRTLSGKYKLVVEFLGYDKYQKTLVLYADEPMPLGTILLKTSTVDLDEVNVVGSANTMQIRGDTTEYNADAFKTQPNAVAEDLITKIPGMEISDGKVKSQGEEIQKVIVDGKSFFGNDPSLALKNLPAEVIDKIQLIDDLSENAQFTGFDDGTRVKTLNIVTKKDKRNGMFGKLSAGVGAEDGGAIDRYNVGGNLSNFNGDRRISVLGGTNNVNEMNFTMQDFLGAMGGRGRGRNMMGMSGQSAGLNTTSNFGLNYSDAWSPKIEVQGSYFYNYNDNQNDQYLYQINTIDSITTISNNLTNGQNANHRFDMKLDYDIDSANSIQFRPSLSFQNYQSNSGSLTSLTQYADFPGSVAELIRASNTDYLSNSSGINLSADLQYRHRFAKAGRSFSVGMNASNNTNDGETQNRDTTINGIEMVTFRPADSATDGYTFAPNMTYTEGLGKNGIVQFNYTYRYSKSNADKKTYDAENESDAYSSIIDTLSNKFENIYESHKAGVTYNYFKQKVNFAVGVNYQRADMQSDRILPRPVSFNASFDNFLPQATFRYDIDRRNNLKVFYSTSTNQPSVTQLQDVLNCDDPNNYSIGNPNLDQEYAHKLSVRLRRVSAEKSRTIMFMLSGSLVNNRIVSTSYRNSSPEAIEWEGVVLAKGVQLTKPVNIDKPYWTANSFFTYGIPVFKQKLNINLNTGANMSNSPNLINNEANTTSSYNLRQGVSLSSNISKNVDFTLNANINYSIVNYSLTPDQNTNSLNQSLGAKMNYIFWNGTIFNTNYTYIANSGLSSGYNANYSLLNVSLGKQLFKKQNGEIKLSVNDALRQNVSVSRSVGEGSITDSRNLVLQRYYMLTFTYNIRSFGNAGNSGRPDRPDHGGFRPEREF